MRPTMNFALHTVLAAAIAALAATGAAAQQAGGEHEIEYDIVAGQLTAPPPPSGNKVLRLQGVGGQSRAGDHKGEIEVLSYAWGNIQQAAVGTWSKADGLGVSWDPQAARAGKMHQEDISAAPDGKDGRKGGNVEFEWKVEEGESAPPPPRGVRVAPREGRAAVGGSQTETIGGARNRDVASGQATGKRQHLPIRTRAMYDQPQAQGSVWVRVSSPWAGCRVGARYPSLELNDGARRYVLHDAVVANCGGARAKAGQPTEEVAFYYNRIAFNY